MDVFSIKPPEWTKNATHAVTFCCPSCRARSTEAKKVWLNRRAPVTDADLKRKWQEFYLCRCDQVWWAWSSDRLKITKQAISTDT